MSIPNYDNVTAAKLIHSFVPISRLNKGEARKIDTMDIVLCGVVRAEIIHGARTDQEIDNYLEAFNTFEKPMNDDYDWEGAGFILQTNV